ncbi:MAG: hypothetical protein GF398_03770 [Chitinivibrionales bacterium]|nr:hypothetical protein [Chitinivibrionales bacterium]
MKILFACVLPLVLSLHTFADEILTLSPEHVCELAAQHSTHAHLSNLAVQRNENAARGARAALGPVVSLNYSYTYLSERPEIDGLGGEFALDSQTLMDTSLLSVIDTGDIAVLGLLNTVFGELFGSEPLPIGPQEMQSLGVQVAQPLFAGFRLLNAYKIAAYSLQISKHKYDRMLAENGLLALQLFWGHVAAHKTYLSAVENRQWLERLERDQQALFESGAILELDVLRTSNAVAQAKLAEMKAMHAIRSSAEALLVFLNLPPDTQFEVDTSSLKSIKTAFPKPTDGEINRRIEQRDDILAASLQRLQLQTKYDIERAGYYPSLSAFWSYDYSNQYTQSDTRKEGSWRVGALMNWTIFDWGKSWREMQQTRIELEAFDARYCLLKAHIKTRINELARTVKENMAALEIAREAVANARRALEISRLRYEENMITNTELLTSRKELTEAHILLSQMKIKVILSQEELSVAPVSLNLPGSRP